MKMNNLLVLSGLLIGASAFAIYEDASKTAPKPQPAEQAHRAHIGVVGGYADPNGELKGSGAYGLDVGFQPFIPFGLGLQALFYNSSFDVPGARVGIKRAEVLAKMTYNFGGETPVLRHAWFGAKMGAVFTTPYVDAGTVTDGDNYTRFGIAPTLGFDIPVATSFSVGLDLTYLFVTGPEKNQDTFQALGALKYWF